MAPISACGIDLVDIARVRKLVECSTADVLQNIFSKHELDYAGDSVSSFARLAARFAAKEACLKLFPKEAATSLIELSDFSIMHDSYGAPCVALSPRASTLADQYGYVLISISLSHTKTHAIAIAIASS